MNIAQGRPLRCSSSRAGQNRRLPAEAGVWVFILGDMTVFALLFFVFLYYRRLDLVEFQSSQQSLNVLLGQINTLILITSSWFVARFMGAYKTGDYLKAKNFLAAGIVAGGAFVAIKVFEYTEKITAGDTILSGDFFMYYYMMTGIHLMHVLVGIAGLLYVYSALSKQRGSLLVVECAAVYWHMVDLLWIFLFPLFYLL